LGQFTDKIDIPENAVGRPGVVRCSWQAVAYDIMGPKNRGGGAATTATNTPSNGEEGKMKTVVTINNDFFAAIAASTAATNAATTTSGPSRSIDASSIAKVVSIAAGFSHSIAVTASGAVFTWGCGTYGRLGHGSHCDEYTPRQVIAVCKITTFTIAVVLIPTTSPFD
jgi:hypothetical protein